LLNLDLLHSVIEESFQELISEFAQEQVKQIEAVEWPWPRETVRSTGEVANSPRNIIDTGALRDSLNIEWVSPTEAIYHWDVDYAIYVHQGAVLSNGTELPARPWIFAAMGEYDLFQEFINKLNEKL
jgi:hypothetical protein